MTYFDGTKLLIERFSQGNQLEVIHSGHLWNASFQWFTPASNKQVQIVQEKFENQLPLDFIDFLTQISNGTTLYYDSQYGQWGFRIYGTEELIEKQEYWQISIPLDWKTQFIAFCELYGEANVMVFDLKRPSMNNDSVAIVEASSLDPIRNWPTVSRSFHEWLDHLITAQGDKYWLWK